jgi:hypothetical protein
MKNEIPLLAALLLIGTSLLGRVTAQGIEQALVSTAIEYGLECIRVVKGFLPNTMRFGS